MRGRSPLFYGIGLLIGMGSALPALADTEHTPPTCASKAARLTEPLPDIMPWQVSRLGELTSQWIQLTDRQGRQLTGRLLNFQVCDGQNFFLAQYNLGVVHVVRPEAVQSLARLSEAEARRHWSITDLPDESILHADLKEIEDGMCRIDKACQSDPDFKALRDQVHKAFQNPLKRKLARRLTANCMAVVPTQALAVLQGIYRSDARKAGKQDFLSEHGSNYAQGLFYMSLLGCFATHAQSLWKTSLAVAATNVAGNVWEEIHLGLPNQRSLPLFNSAGRQVKTDWQDFSAGVLSSATFLLAHALLEEIARDRSEPRYRFTCPQPQR